MRGCHFGGKLGNSVNENVDVLGRRIGRSDIYDREPNIVRRMRPMRCLRYESVKTTREALDNCLSVDMWPLERS